MIVHEAMKMQTEKKLINCSYKRFRWALLPRLIYRRGLKITTETIILKDEFSSKNGTGIDWIEMYYANSNTILKQFQTLKWCSHRRNNLDI